MTSWKMLGKFRVKVYLNLKMYFSFKLKNEIIKTGVPRVRRANGFLCGEMEEVHWAGLICNRRVSL